MSIRRNLLAVGLATVLGAISGLAVAQEQAADLSAANANVYTGGGNVLTLASGRGMPATVADFLRARGHDAATLASLVVSGEHASPNLGTTHLRMDQQVNGLTVFGTYVKAAFDNDGNLIYLIENLAAATAGVVPAAADTREALDVALGEVHPGLAVALEETGRSDNTVSFGRDAFFHRDPTVTRVAIAMANGALHEGYLVETWSEDDNLLHHTLVGGSGRVLGVQLRTNNDSYNIFPDHPDRGGQILTDGPGGGNAESPEGWLAGSQTTTDIAGNNAHAYLDTDANNAPDSGGFEVYDGNFDAVADLTAEPETTVNQEVAVQNLFYWNNVIHDTLYRHGFTESAGNFQEDNFGNGGQGGDSVNAEAQDGSGTNNANFSTPSDGSSPRMQMYLWTQTSPRRDGDVDSDIIWHEYGHGLTWRMIGNMSGPMSGAIGEGMSDVLAILINDDDVVGEYSTNDPNGIRSAPYSAYSRTYGDMTGSSVHFDGEIYAATIWRLWQLFQVQPEASLNTLFDYLVGGMSFTAPGPAMEDMRDGILQAAAGSGDECLIWEAFAQSGIGVGADGRIRGGGPFGGGKVTITESFDMPAECLDPGNPAPVVTITEPADGASFASGATITFRGTATDEPDGDLSGSIVWTSGNVEIHQGSTFTTTLSDGVHVITADVIDSGRKPGSDSITITVGAAAPAATMYVASITFLQKGRGLTGIVKVAGGADGAAVADATVTASFCHSGVCPFPSGSTSVTNGKGEAQFKIIGFDPTDTYTLTVEDVSHATYTYDEDSNSQTSADYVQ